MNNIKILKNYILYFLTMLLVCMVGISDIFAETLDNIGYLDNYTDVLVEVSYNAQPLPLTRTNTYQLGSVDAMNIEVSNYTFTAGITYVLEFYTPHTTLDYANAFTVVGNDNNNNSVSCATSDISYHDTYYLTMKFNCSSNVNYINARVYNSQGNYIMDTGIFAWNYLYLRRVASGTDLSVLESQNAQIIQGQQDIINNQNQNTDKVIESQKVCTKINIDKSSGIKTGYLATNGAEILEGSSSSYYVITDYIEITTETDLKVTQPRNSGGALYCFYNIDKEKISCGTTQNMSVNEKITIPNNAKYFRATIEKSSNIPTYYIETCKNGNQAVSDSINDLNDSLNDDDSSGATSEASEFFNSFTTNTFGLTSIITAPLNLIQSLTSSTCSELHLPLPYLNNKYLDLPCMTSIYQTHFGAFFTMYQTITYGIIAYWVCVRIFNQVKDFKNPEHDEIEVVDL